MVISNRKGQGGPTRGQKGQLGAKRDDERGQDWQPGVKRGMQGIKKGDVGTRRSERG